MLSSKQIIMNQSKWNQVEISEEYSHHNDTTLQQHLSTGLSNFFLIIDFLLLIPTFYFHYLIKLMCRREKEKQGHVLIKNLLASYARIVPIVFALCFAYANVVLRYTSHPSYVFGDWFCYAYEIFMHSGSFVVGSFSLFAALTKYWFIVNNANAKRFGEERARTIFLILYLSVPVFIANLNSISNGDRDQIAWVNYCWRTKVKVEIIENTEPKENTEPILTTKSDFFCKNHQYEIEKYVGIAASSYIIPLLRVICVSLKPLYVVFLSNIAELIIYAFIFKYLNRLVYYN